VSDAGSHAQQHAQERWREVVERSSSVLLLIQLSTRRIVARSSPAETLVGVTESAYDLAADRERSRRRLELLENGVIDGYRFRSNLTDQSGTELNVEFDVQRLEDAGDLALAVLTPHDDAGPAHLSSEMRAFSRATAPTEREDPMMLGIVDSAWQISRVSNDVVDLLGYEPKALIGTPFTQWVHPSDLGRLLIAIGRALEDGESVTVRFRARRERDQWLPLVAVIIPLVGPDLAEYAFLARPIHDPDESDQPAAETNRMAELEHRLWRITREVHAAGVGLQICLEPDLNRLPEINELTARQLEVLTRLLQGQRVPTIAAQMYISPSTVRNHLAAIYRKLGVHSQAELLAHVRTSEGLT
jgi:DNA-binding CsgD family transcriptional regulator/PAS domain-containing protein